MKRGWCPSVFEPMPSGDGMVARIKPPGSMLTAAQARTLADAAARWGNGVIEATLRANLQIRGLSAATAPPFAAAMIEAGLAHADPAIERRRNVIAGPGAAPLAAALERALAEDTGLAALPAKFGFLVDAGGVPSPAGAPADIWITLEGATCEVGVDGAQSMVRASANQAPAVAIALANAFLRAAAAATPRMRTVVAACGEAAIFADRSVAPAPARPGKRSGDGQPRIGRLSADIFGVGLPFGSTTSAGLSALADVAGVLHVTPWRTIAMAGADAARLAALDGLAFIIDPADPRLAIAACPGRPGCASASVDTRALANSLAATRPPGLIHVSGCAKGCAHPGPAATTLVGNAGRYDLVRNGPASAVPCRRALTEAEAIAAL